MANTLADLVGSPRTDVIPGFQLSSFTVDMLAQAEFEFSRKHLEVVMAAAESATDRIAGMMLRVANEHIADKQFVFGSRGFRINVWLQQNVPFLLYLSLQPKHPDMTRTKAAAMVTPDNEMKTHRCLLELMGFKLDPEKKITEPEPSAPLTGEKSSPPSADAGSLAPT
jgi:hypothetical protein